MTATQYGKMLSTCSTSEDIFDNMRYVCTLWVRCRQQWRVQRMPRRWWASRRRWRRGRWRHRARRGRASSSPRKESPQMQNRKATSNLKYLHEYHWYLCEIFNILYLLILVDYKTIEQLSKASKKSGKICDSIWRGETESQISLF